jgi:hypothetical protein
VSKGVIMRTLPLEYMLIFLPLFIGIGISLASEKWSKNGKDN